MGLKVHGTRALTGRGVDLREGARHVQGGAVGRELQVHDGPVGRGAQRLARTRSIHSGHPVDGLVVDGGEVTAEVDGGSIGRGLDRVDLAVDLGCPVQQRTGGDVEGHGVVARRLVLTSSGAGRTSVLELPDDVDRVAHDRLILDDAVDLSGGEGLRGGEVHLPLCSSGRRCGSRGDERAESEREGGEDRPHAGDSTGRMHECSVLKT